MCGFVARGFDRDVVDLVDLVDLEEVDLEETDFEDDLRGISSFFSSDTALDFLLEFDIVNKITASYDTFYVSYDFVFNPL